MLIPGFRGIQSPSTEVAPRPGASEGFSVPDHASQIASPPSTSTPVRAQTPVTASMLLAMQERSGQETTDREAEQHGHRVIHELGALQQALLSGTEADMHARLSALADIDLTGADPALARVLSSIRLRARLEAERLARTIAKSR